MGLRKRICDFCIAGFHGVRCEAPERCRCVCNSPEHRAQWREYVRRTVEKQGLPKLDASLFKTATAGK